MQIYLAVQNARHDTLVLRKKEFNHWWQSRAAEEVLVSQAGQWVLPGGKGEAGESPVLTAIRRFKEETGINLQPQAHAAYVLEKNNRYALVSMQLASLGALVDEVNSNVAENLQNSKVPNSVRVEDWEIQDADLIEIDALAGFLGAAQPVSERAARALHAASLNSQSIDSFSEIAKILKLQSI